MSEILPAGSVPVRARFKMAPALWLLLPALLLAACAPREHRPAGAWLAERELFFREHPDWRASGRIGLSDGQRGGSLSFSWTAQGDNHIIHLRTLAGGSQWRLDFGPGYALLEGSDVGQLVGANPEPLVEAAVGWPIPVDLLARWIRGLPAPPGARPEFSADGALAGFGHDGWTLSYTRWREQYAVLMPQRMDAVRTPNRVRLVISEWQVGDG